LHVERDTDCERHLVGVIDTHSKQPLHCLEFPLIFTRNRSAALFVDKLNDAARDILSLTVHRAHEEVTHLSRRGLVVDLVLEFGLFCRIVRDVDLPALENHTRDARVSGELHEMLVV
jgi:hypothetical protein